LTSDRPESQTPDKIVSRRQYIKYAGAAMAAVAAAGLGYYATRPSEERTTKLGAETMTVNSSSTMEACRGISIPTNGCYLGAYIGDFPAVQEINRFADMIGRHLAILNLYLAWGDNSLFPSKELTSYVANGQTPMISWKPVLWDSVNKRDIPTIGLQDIIEGRWDNYLERWAEDARAFGHPLFLRLAWEMNGDSFRHCGPNNFGPNGDNKWNEVDDLYRYYGDPKRPDGPERYIDAWRHVRDLFERAGARNIVWVWAPGFENWPNETWNTSESYYPGDEYVDWVGVTLCNHGYVDGRPQWRSFDALFSKTEVSRVYTEHTSKPFMLAEWTCSQAESSQTSGDKARWITEAFRDIKSKCTGVKAVLWFSKDMRAWGGNERDWRIDSSPESLGAYRDAVSDPYFLDHITCHE